MMNKYLVMLVALLLGVGLVFSGNTSKAETDLTSDEYITDIMIVSGDASVESAEESGWKVMADRIDESMIAYRTGSNESDALKNLFLLSSGSRTETIDNISYQEQGSIGGLKLYGTKDASAGEAITALRIIDEPLRGDGSHTVRDRNGEVRELGSDRYLATTHAGNVGMYVSELALITAGSEKSAMRKAADKGFDFFRLIRNEDDVELIAFNRTDDEKKAVRGIYAVNKGDDGDYRLYYSISPAAGAPIADIELKEVVEILWDEGGSLLGEWAKMSTGSEDDYNWNAISVFEDKAEFRQALQDHGQGTESVEIVVAQKDGADVGTGEIELEGVDMSTFFTEEDEEENPEDEQTEDGEQTEGDEDGLTDDEEFGASDEPVSEVAYDDPGEDSDKESETEASGDEGSSGETSEDDGSLEKGDEEGGATGSLIGSGSIYIIVGGVICLAVILLVGLIYKKKKGGAEGDRTE